MPGAGASATCFNALVAALDSQGQIYGLQPRGIDGKMIPYSTVSAAASAYMSEIKNIFPQSSIHLLGHSFGGWVVFEMAHILKSTGIEIGSLTIIDSRTPGNEGDYIQKYNDIEALMKLVKLFEQDWLSRIWGTVKNA